MSVKEFKTVCSENVAGPQKGTHLKNTPLLTSLPLSTASSMYTFISETYRDLKSYISGLNKDLRLIETINKYKKGCNEVYTKALESYSTCYQLAQNIVRTMDIFKELCTCLSDLEEYNYRLCEIMSIFIACELRLSADAPQHEQLLIAQRIIYIMRRHLVQEEEHETSLNILRTLVYIPKLFNARDIMCALFGEFIPLKPVPEVNVLPDKIYILYIIVFHRWMIMQKGDDDKLLILNFAESFMKPSVSLCSNNLYGSYLPMYTKHSTATRTILNNLKYYGDVRNASIIDNALKKIGTVVNLCDDDDDDIVLVETSFESDFSQTFASVRLEPLSCGMSNIKLEKETVVDTVDLTADDESLNTETGINNLHDKWLNDFQNLAKQYRESQLILEMQQNKNVVSDGDKQAVICLDSDSEEEAEEITTVKGKETATVEANKQQASLEKANKKNNLTDLYVDNYPLTSTPLNFDSVLESTDTDNEDDVTKISPRFMPSNLRTYQAKKSNLVKAHDNKNFGVNEPYTLPEMEKAIRRNSIHISSTELPQDEDEDDEGTDVQDENDDDDDGDGDSDDVLKNEVKGIRPMGPYPTYNSVTNDKVVFSQSQPRYSQHQHYQEEQFYLSDNTEIKTPKKQKKRVQFKDTPRFLCAPEVEDTKVIYSSAKQQDHLEAAEFFFRRTYQSPTRVPGGTSRYEKSSDDYYDVLSDSDIVSNKRYKGDEKLRKSCMVVIEHTEETLQYQREQNQMYNEILKEQRRKLELRAVEKQREKELRTVGRRREELEEQQNNLNNKATTIVNDNKTVSNRSRTTRNYHEIFMSSESENDTFQVRTRKQKSRNIKVLEPLKIQTDTTTLLSQIEAHLDQSAAVQSYSFEMNNKQQEEKSAITNDSHNNQPPCDNNTDKNNTKLNLLADIAQHLSPYQIDLPENKPPRPPSSSIKLSSPVIKNAAQNASFMELPKEKVIVTEQLFLQSIDNLLDNRKPQLDNNEPQQQASPTSYAHEAKQNKSTSFKTSLCTNTIQNEIQNNTQLEKKNNDIPRDQQTRQTESDATLEQILDESISVTVASPYNSFEEREALSQRGNSTTPIIISNVESLNQLAQNDEIEKTKTEDKLQLLLKPATNSGNVVLEENEISRKSERKYNTKDVIENGNITNKSTIGLPLNDVDDSSVMSPCHNPQTHNVPSISAADFSDISLESELSKQPSPVVTTDMSDYSNESHVSKSFHEQILNIRVCAPNTVQTTEMPDLSLLMPIINHSSTNLTTNQQDCLETNFNQFNSTLNTPIKQATDISKETEINTPPKFPAQPEFLTNTTPLKNGFESEAVAKFLDPILNKTVTDAESETRDKIIEELSALTEEAMVVSNNSEIVQSEKPNEANSLESKENDKEIDLKEISFSTDSTKLDKMCEYNSCQRKDKNFLDKKNSETEVLKESPLQTESANIEINPPKPNRKEGHKELLHDIKSTELSDNLHSTSFSHSEQIRTLPIKQTFNIKCRVRLKRLNKNHLSNLAQNESLSTMPSTKPVELQSSNIDITKCDTATEKTLKIKKTSLKVNKRAYKELNKAAADETTTTEVKKPKYDSEKSFPTDAIPAPISQTPDTPIIAQFSKSSDTLINNNTIPIKPKVKTLKTVTFDLSNLIEEHRDSTPSSYKQKSSRSSRKLSDNTLRAAETLQILVNKINDSTRTSPPAEFNKKRNPIKNKCIAEDETPRPPPASTLMGTPPCKKSCRERSRTHLTSKCKDQLVSSLATSAIPSITSDATTARIYTSSPLDQTLPEYDDNVDAVADSELILNSSTGSLRRKVKRSKKSLTRPGPSGDVSTDDIGNQPDCNVEEDTDAVVDNEDDVFVEELLPIPAANEHILEEIVSARPTHIGTGIRDDYINIEATPTVPDNLFNDESRELGSPEVIQSSEYTNVVDSSSYLNTTSITSAAPNNLAPTSASTNVTLGSLEKSMLSPSEHEVSSTQETLYQTPIKNKQTEIFGEKSSTSKEKGNINSLLTNNAILKIKSEDNKLKKTEDYQTSSTVGLLQNNQVDTTNHSPEMCTVAMMSTTTTTTTTTNILANNRKLRKASTHDEILFNELQQQLPSSKRKSNSAKFYVESTSDNSKTKVLPNNLDDVKSNRSLAKSDDKFKKLLKEVSKIDKEQAANALEGALPSASNNNGGEAGGSSPSTTTTINEECLSRSKRKKSSKSKKNKNRSERSSKISLKPSKLTPHVPANSLSPDDQQQSEFLNIPISNLFIEKLKETTETNEISLTKKELTNSIPIVEKKSNNCAANIQDTNPKLVKISQTDTHQVTQNTNSTAAPKEIYSSNPIQTIKNKEKLKIIYDAATVSKTTSTKNSNNIIFAEDKYDLIKNKDKHHHHRNQNQNQDKTKEKVNSNIPLNSSRTHKGKIKGEKSKEKHKKTLPPTKMQPIIIKLPCYQHNNKSSSTTLPATATLISSHNKESNTKSSKTTSTSSSLSSSSSSSASLPISLIIKTKTNSSTTHLLAAKTATGSSKSTHHDISK